jgi:hypothetical protein
VTAKAKPATTRHEGRAFAAALLAERRTIAMAFRAAGATEPGKAATLETLGIRYNAPFHELTTLKVIHIVGNTYWFDDEAFTRTVEQPRFRVVGMLTIAAIFVLFVIVLVGVLTAPK